jgi:hypothetical protein
MTTVDRLFTQLAPATETGTSAPRRLADFDGAAAIVLLGDPGSGKTTCFKQAATELNAEYVSVRDFLAFPPSHWEARTLYLDGLDEVRANSDDGRVVIDRLLGHLDQLGRPSFRLSCREADWYGSSDLGRLARVSADGDVTVLRLEPLTDRDVVAIANEVVGNGESFLEEAQQRGLEGLLHNPQTLNLLLTAAGQGEWPHTREETFRRACEVLAKEPKEEHLRVRSRPTRTTDLLEAAGYACAVLLCSGRTGAALSVVHATDEFPDCGEWPYDAGLLRFALRSRMFRAVGAERVVYVHRTVAEYLAAHFLTARIRAGLSLGRVLSLITGHDGGTLSDLRGVFAWLACLCEEHAPALIFIDPLSVVLYGDPGCLSPSTKELVLRSLARIVERDPWFRSEDWAAQPFGSLATPEMEPLFLEILHDASSHPMLADCVLDAVIYGQPLPGLGDSLLAIVRDDACRRYLRRDAIRAFEKACPDRIRDLKDLLDEIHAGGIADTEQELRGALLQALYPEVLSPQEVLDYLVPGNEHFFGAYALFVAQELVEHTPTERLPDLFDAISGLEPSPTRHRRFGWGLLLGSLLTEALHHFGENVSIDRLYRWLGTALGQHGEPFIDERHAREVGDWLAARPALIRALLQHWVSATPRENCFLEYRNFIFRLQRADFPDGYPGWLLEFAGAAEDDELSEFLVGESVSAWLIPDRKDAPTLETLQSWAEVHLRRACLVDLALQCRIPEWRWEEEERKEKWAQERLERRAGWVASLTTHLDDIRAGLYLVPGLAFLYFGLSSESDSQLDPVARLVTEASPEVAEAAMEGFVRAVRHPEIPSPERIGAVAASPGRFDFGFLVLAGMDLIAERSMEELLALPAETLQSALAFHYANHTGGERPWVAALIAAQPALAAEALAAFWRPQLTARSDHVIALYGLDQDSAMADVARRVVLALLCDYPDCSPQCLRTLHRAALRHGDHGALLDLGRDLLERRCAVRGPQRILWFVTTFVLDSEGVALKLARYIGKDTAKAWALLDFLCPVLWEEHRVDLTLSPAALGHLILITGRIVPPSDAPLGLRERRREDEAARQVRGLIDHLAGDITPEAASVFATLREAPALAAWNDFLAHAAADQARKRRESIFRYPKLDQVLSTLATGPPANAADLQALLVDHLRTLAKELRDGSTDGYKMFWNVDPYGRPQNPRPENDCRDRLLDLLRPTLRSIGIAAEPEGHYAEDKRADIKCLCGDLNLPIEIKRHYHRDLWTAPEQQLRKLYARDPGTEGRGIYLVLWFGEGPGRRIPKAPEGIPQPQSPVELEEALREVIPEGDRTAIEVIVFDCSPA